MEDVEKILDREVRKGIKEKFPDGLSAEYRERLDYELGIIKEMGYADYHLIVKDYLEYGRLLGYIPKNYLENAPLTINELKSYITAHGWKNPGMTVGPGRGSAVGSLVCYLLGITSLDPIKYGLLFERFLNPERVSMPDIDSDFAKAIRSKVIEYVKGKYGEKSVCAIMTKTYQGPKRAVETASKYYGFKAYGTSLYSLGKTIMSDIPSDVGTAFNTKVDKITGKVDKDGEIELKEYLCNKYAQNNDALEILHWAFVLEGSFTAYGAHAAGIVISDNEDVSQYMPLRYNSNMHIMTSQCDMVQVEENGLLKFDFLGLKTLDIINDTIHSIEANYGIIIDPYRVNLEDRDVYKEIFSRGRTNAVFQFESSGMKSMLKRFKPACFEDLIILVSMFRPGPLQYLDTVIEVKNGTKKMTFACTQLEPILSKTYGAIVYQEQVMEICQQLAGFTLGHADTVRRYMSKKKADKLEHEREAFVDGCTGNGIAKEIAEDLFNQMMDFASYAFNKSHAAVYAYNAYLTAWLKYHYPAEFLASALNWSSSEKMQGLVYEAKTCGVKVYAPDINRSGREFSAEREAIYFGLSSVKGVKNTADVIIEERANGSYETMSDFMLRVYPNSTVLNNLVDAGAFDGFGKNRTALKSLAEDIKKSVQEIKNKQSFIASGNAVLPFVEKASDDELIHVQEDAGLKVEIKKSTTADKLMARIANAQSALDKSMADLKLKRPDNRDEDKEARMNQERELLGMYITEHPMDIYAEPADVGATLISDIKEGDETISGVITNLVIKHRKVDNAKMAFFTLEDKSGMVDVIVFVKAYRRYSAMIQEGKVVKIQGKCQAERENTADEEETEETFKFFAETFQNVGKKKKTIVLPVKSVEDFTVTIGESFRNTYGEHGCYDFALYDESKDKFIRMKYLVNENVLEIPKVEILFK